MAREYEGIANALASRGRGTDTMLLHVSPAEIQYLEAIAPSMGINLPNGKLPLNPDTGQPEALAFLLPLLAALPAALSAGVGAGSLAAVPGAIGTSLMGSLTAASSAFTGMFTGGLSGLSTGILGEGITGLIGLGGEAAQLGGGTAAEIAAAELGAGFVPEGATGVAETTAAGLESLGAGPWSAETALTAGEAIEGGMGAAEAAQLAVPELAGKAMGEGLGVAAQAAGDTAATGFEALGAGPWSTETAVAAGEAVEGGATAAEAAELAMEPLSFMDKVQAGLEAFQADPFGEVGKWVQKGAQTAIEHPVETAGGIVAIDAMMPEDEDTPREGGPGETWASRQEGGDPFTYGEKGTGGGQMKAGRDLIADSGVPASMGPGVKMGAMQRASDFGVPSIVDQGLGSMPVGPDTAAPVGLGAAQMADMAGAEEAFDLMQDEGVGLADMSIDEILSSLPDDITLEQLEEIKALMAQQGGLYA